MNTSSQPAHTAARSRSMLRIFLSSTSVDLKAHRDAVRHVVDTFDEHPVVMDDFGAHDGDATTVSLDKLRSCSVYVLLLGWRYGTIPDGETLSVTHLEYRAARDAGMPRFIFLADADTEKDDGPDALFPAAVRDPDHATQMRNFREEVGRDRVAAYFTTPDNAALAVAAALHNYIQHELPPGPHPPNKLAPRAPGFVGREGELRELCQRLRAGQSIGLSALVAGLAGVGKSALAAEALSTLAADPDAFPGGITWARCDEREGLGGLTWLYDQLLADWGAPLAPEQLAQAQTVGPEAEAELRERALQTRLRAFASETGALPPALALLDNVEVGLPLARALETLASLGITALVTARHQPSVVRLQLLPLDVLEPLAAARLFAERYHEKGGAWDDTRDSDAAAAIVERLGRLPLAIELQAARAALRQTSVGQVSADLERDRSQGLLGDPLDATRNMRYSFDQSLKTLTPLQRTRFSALGLPDGPDWPRAVIERLLAGIQEQEEEQGETPEDTEPSASARAAAQADLDRFVALSLANLQPPDGRVRLHALLREYAHELWQEHSQSIQTMGLKALLKGVQQFVAAHLTDYPLISAEERMVVDALTRTLPPHIADPSVMDILNDLWSYFSQGGHWQLGEQLLQQALATEYVRNERRALALFLSQLGQLAHSLGQTELAQQSYERALSITRDLGDRQGEGAILYGLGYVFYSLGQPQQAQQYFDQSLAIAREVDNREDEGDTLNALGLLAYSLGQPEQARAYFEQALAILRDVGHREGEGATLNGLGLLADSLGQPEQARAYFEQALVIAREVGDRSGEGTILNNLGLLARSLGQLEQARSYFEQALVIHRAVAHRQMEGTTLNNLGALAYGLEQPETARGYYEQALVIVREVGNRSNEGATLNNLGELARSLGQQEQARSYYEQALRIFHEIGAVDSERAVFGNLAYLDGQSAPAGDTANDEADVPQEKTPQRKRRRWPWSKRL